MSAWAGSIAAELKPFGVDVTVVHPSPVASNFYANAVGFKMLEAPKASAQSPDSLVDHMFRGMGRVSILDQGGVTVAMRLGLKMADWGLITEAMRLFGGILPDFVNFRKRGLEECGIKDELVGGKWARKDTKKGN
jgi:NAD(P)-dependent dehydrogenase (short-subunit alcohol dehydrogenase family)